MSEQIDEKTLTTTMKLPDRIRTGMIIPTSKETYSNTQWKAKAAPLCAYDMLFHPPDYNPKAGRTDRQQPQIIRQNIWDQEFHKGIPSTTHFTLGRPKWLIPDRPTKLFVRVVVSYFAHVYWLLSATIKAFIYRLKLEGEVNPPCFTPHFNQYGSDIAPA